MARDTPEHVEVAIVGGGQAGLAMSWHLQRAGRHHVVLDRGRPGDTWRLRRWDAFCLVTPNWTLRLPGFPYGGDDPNGFMSGHEVARHLARYVASFEPPLRSGVEVTAVVPRPTAGFALETSAGSFVADNVVVATGTYQRPRFPAMVRSTALALQLHSSEYRSAAALPEGRVLVVGSGQSGAQIADDLRRAGREVHLSTSRVARAPRRYRGKDLHEWSVVAGWFDRTMDKHPDGEGARFATNALLTGRDGGRDLDLRILANGGVKLLGRLAIIEGTEARFESDVAENVAFADARFERMTTSLDEFVAAKGLDAPPDDRESSAWTVPAAPNRLDLSSFGAVIWATGHRWDFSWVHAPIFDDRGYPVYQRGVTAIPGLYFLGLNWLHTWGSGLFYGVGEDAGYLAEHISHRPD